MWLWLIKRCSKCKNVCLKNFVNIDKSREDGVRPACKPCRKIVERKITKFHNLHRLIVSTRRRIYKSLKGKTKQSSTKEIVGIDNDIKQKVAWVSFYSRDELVDCWYKSIDTCFFIRSFEYWKLKGSLQLKRHSTTVKRKIISKKEVNISV